MIAALRVLLVEDSPTDAKLVLHALRATGRAIEHERVQDADAMRAALANASWDLVLSDWSMPHFDALGALAVLKESGIDVPFIIVSGTIGEELAVDAMRAGAHDYVLKDKLARLAPAVERELRDAAERTARGITEAALARAEAATLAEQARFRALVEKSADGIVLSAPSGELLYLSPAAATILGRNPEDAIGTNFRDYLHADDATAALEQHRVLLATRQMAPAIRRIVRSDGTIRWIEVTATNRTHDPAIGAIVANIRDITDRRQAEDALVVAQHRFTALFDSGIVGIIVAEASGAVCDANETFLNMLGYTRDDLAAGRVDWRKATPPEWASWNDGAGEDLRLHGRANPREKEYLRKDGTRVPVLVGVAKVEGPYVISLSVDLTERRRAEHANASLEAQLRQAQKMEAVGRLAGGVAHDFNNVLSVILSYADILLGELKAGDPMREDIDEIRKAGARAATLTRQLLLFSRQQVIEPSLVDLNELLANMDKMLQRIVGEDVDLVSATKNRIGTVRVDPSSIEQVVMNLVVNARDAMPTGGKLTIETANVVLDEEYARTHVGVSPGAYVMLAVSDTGAGMDKATQAQIFEPFFTTKEKGKGTGLGLSTVFGIVMASSGSVWVYSEPGRGTTFKVYLPRVDQPAHVAGMTLPPATLRGTETILLVEDDDQLRAVARGILKRHGYEVIDARNAGEAILLSDAHAGTIHLLVSDVVMPRMSGPELAKRLSIVRPDLKVLCVSGYTDDSIVRHGVLAGHFAFLQKPITPETLTRKVREVLDARTPPAS